jgi:flagellin-like hook-associated protein FlgL
MTGISLTSRIDLNTIVLRERLTKLGDQISTGRKGNSYAALGTEAPKAMDMRADIGRRETYQNTIGQTLSKVQVTQNVLNRIGAIAEKFAASSTKLLGAAKPEEIQIQAGQAKAALVEVAHLLNENYAGEYLFGGTDTHNPPIPNPNAIATTTTGMAKKIADEVAKLNATNATTVLTAITGWATDDDPLVTPFSEYLETGDGKTEGRRNLLVSDNERIDYGIIANRNAAVVSSGETTGSWARDLLRGLASIAGLTPEKSQLGQSYVGFVTKVQEGLRSSVDALALERGALGVTEARLQSVQTLHESVTVSLTLQVRDLEEVDMAKTITSFQATQTQLEASYRAIAIAQQLSLTRFLS